MKHLCQRHRWMAAGTYCALIFSAIGCSSGTSLDRIASSAEQIGKTSQAVITAGRAPDPTGRGELDVATTEYKLPASVDPNILTDRATEAWARVWRPLSSDNDESRRLPLVVFLHGNHGTCGTFFCRAAICGTDIPLPDGPRIDDRIDYTTTGTCPRMGEGTPPAEHDYVVSPSHEGYAYLAEQLASRGYLVVSINANRGVTAGAIQSNVDRGLNLARGRLVLKHLMLLSRWNQGLDPTPASLGFDLRDRIDFSRVALIGHSRGGEGVRAAYNLYTGRNADFAPYAGINWRGMIPNTVNIRGIFEIAPVDRQTGRTLNAEGVTWNTMIGSCDGDVINQQGIWPYDRMIKSFTEQPAAQKSFYYVVGANHNYWNTEWQFSDSSGCFNPAEQLFVTDPDTGILPGVTGSASQRTTGSASVLALVRGVLRASDDEDEDEGSFSRFLRNFDPQYGLPPVVTNVARIQRGFIASPSSQVTQALEDFDRPTGTSQFGVPNDTSNLTAEHVPVIEHGIPFSARDEMGNLVALPPFVRAAKVTWQSAGANVFFQINFAAPGGGIDLSRFATLDFRVDRESPKRTTLNPSNATNFHVQLVASDGSLSEPVAAGDFAEIVGPFGTPDADLSFINPAFPDGFHTNLPTARIPIGNFRFRDLNQTRGIRLTFDDTPTGQIYLTDFRASRQGVRSLESESDQATVDGASILNASSRRMIDQGNFIEDVRFVAGVATGAGNGTVRFTVWTETPVAVGNELLTMAVGAVQCDGSYVDGTTQRMIFDCPAEALSSVADGEPIRAGNNATMRWYFGEFDSSMLN